MRLYLRLFCAAHIFVSEMAIFTCWQMKLPLILTITDTDDSSATAFIEAYEIIGKYLSERKRHLAKMHRANEIISGLSNGDIDALSYYFSQKSA